MHLFRITVVDKEKYALGSWLHGAMTPRMTEGMVEVCDFGTPMFRTSKLWHKSAIDWVS